MDINGYFGFIIVKNKNSGFPELLFYLGTSSFRFSSHDLTTIVLTPEGLTEFEESCVEVFSPLPDEVSSSDIAGYAIKSTELQFFLIILFGVVVSVFQLLIPVISATLVSSAIPDGNLQYSFQLSGIMVLSSLLLLFLCIIRLDLFLYLTLLY